MEPDSGNGVGQDINNDYSIIYRFADDDGVIAIVKNKKNITPSSNARRKLTLLKTKNIRTDENSKNKCC